MAYQLYPPSISGSLPAIQLLSQSNDNNIVSVYHFQIPFTLNRGVAWNDIGGFAVKIKNRTMQAIATSVAEINEGTENFNLAKETGILQFDVSIGSLAIEIIPEEFYKIQLAFKGKDGIVGYYSTVGFAKCVSEQGYQILINETESGDSLNAAGLYEIKYIAQDYTFNNMEIQNTEKPYSFQYAIIHTNNNYAGNIQNLKFKALQNTNVIVDYLSSEIFHTNHETSNKDYFEYWTDLNENSSNFLLLKFRTTNNAYFEYVYPLVQNFVILNDEVSQSAIGQFSMNVKNNYEDAFINVEVSINTTSQRYVEVALLRTESNKNPYSWLKLGSVELSMIDSKIVYKDFCVEHGTEYIYAIEYSDSFGTTGESVFRLYSQPIRAMFEDMFLLDSNGRQLRVQYNPKMSSFKQNILEQKIDTIGSQYPFFFRNGRVKYKDFPIAGLISYLIDSNELFLTDEDLGIIENFVHRDITSTNTFTHRKQSIEYHGENFEIHGNIENNENEQPAETGIVNIEPDLSRRQSLDDLNIYAERIFKRSVQDWLGNGEVKLLKTPTEGTFLIRLTNVSLTPEDRLSRMLHNFSCQAYEVGDFNHSSLYKYGFIQDSLIKNARYGWSSDIRVESYIR